MAKEVEPRWKKIWAITAEALEKEIALSQTKVIISEVSNSLIQSVVNKQGKTEGKVEFEQRNQKIEEQKEVTIYDMEQKKVILEMLMEKYVVHLKGGTAIGERSGTLEDLDDILGEKDRSCGKH